MKTRLLMGLGFVLTLLSSSVFAYHTQVALRTCQNRLPSDDIMVTRVMVYVPPYWDEKDPPVIVRAMYYGHRYDVTLIDNTVSLEVDLPIQTGVVARTIKYPSMDYLHSAISAGENKNMRLQAVLYIGKDFTWVELKDRSPLVAPINNTVYFVGMGDELWEATAKRDCNVLHFANYNELKADIDTNYSAVYYPTRIPPLIEYGNWGKAALLSTVK